MPSHSSALFINVFYVIIFMAGLFLCKDYFIMGIVFRKLLAYEI